MLAGHVAYVVHVVFVCGVALHTTAQAPEAPSANPLIGVNAEESAQGLVVRSLIPNSAAVGHLQPGDVLRFLTADGHPAYSAQSFADLAKAKAAIGTDVDASLEILRNGRPRLFAIKFLASGTRISELASSPALNAPEKASAFTENPPQGSAVSVNEPSEVSGDLQSDILPEPPGIDFHRLVVASLVKAGDAPEQLSIMKPGWRKTTREVTVEKVAFEDQLRERSVQDPETGEVRAEQYSVRVPKVHTETRIRELLVPTQGSESVVVPLENLVAWTVDGQKLTMDELRRRFSKKTRVFVLDESESAYASSVLSYKIV